jgi:arsenate reductase-like glutaredoxin family protein
MNIGDLITFFGPLTLATLTLTSLTGIIALIISSEKAERTFLIFILVIMLLLSGYTVSDFLLALFGFNIGDATRIEQNKTTIIMLSRFEIFFLTLGLISLSALTSYLIKGKASFIKFALTFLIGSIIGILSLTSDKFFYNDRLKLSINKYMGQEGDLFIIFIIFFAIVIIVELPLLILAIRKSKNKSDIDLERLKSITFGILTIILFGVLEALNLFGIIQLYPYVPSLLGMGMATFGIIIFTLSIREFNQKTIEAQLLDKVISESNDGIKDILHDATTKFSKLGNNIVSFKESFTVIFELPTLASQYVTELGKEETSFSEEYFRKLPTFEKIVEEYNSKLNNTKISEKIGTVNNLALEMGRKLKDIEKVSERVEEMRKQNSQLVERFSTFAQKVESYNSILFDLEEMLENSKNWIEQLRIITINTEIISSKRFNKNSPFLSSISSEILEKVTESKPLLDSVSRKVDEIKSTEVIITSTAEKVGSSLLDLNNKLNNYKVEFEFFTGNEGSLEKILLNTKSVLEEIKHLGDFVELVKKYILEGISEFDQEFKLDFSSIKEVFFTYSDLVENAKSITESILSIEETLEKSKNSLQIIK